MVEKPLATQATRASVVYDTIRHDILACRLRPGQWLRSEVMKLEYGAGVSTIREAFSRLATEGLVEVVDQRGVKVAPVSVNDLQDLLRVREHMESLALQWSIQRGDESWESHVVANFHLLQRSLQRGSKNLSDDTEVQQRHDTFHQSLVSACGSPRLMQWIATLYGQTQRYRLIADYGRSWDSDVLREHEEIMTASLEHDVELACRLFREHAARTVDLALVNLAQFMETQAAAG